MTEELRELELQQSQGLDLGLGMVTEAYEKPKNCFKIEIPCDVLEKLERQKQSNTIYSIEYNVEQVNFFDKNNTDIDNEDDLNSKVIEFQGENCTSNCTDTCGFQCLALCNLTCGIGSG